MCTTDCVSYMLINLVLKLWRCCLSLKMQKYTCRTLALTKQSRQYLQLQWTGQRQLLQDETTNISDWGFGAAYTRRLAVFVLLMMTSSNGNISTLLPICAGKSPVPGEFFTQRPVTRRFDVFFDLRLNKWLSKQSWGWWFGTLSCPLWRQCNVVYRSNEQVHSYVCPPVDRTAAGWLLMVSTSMRHKSSLFGSFTSAR